MLRRHLARRIVCQDVILTSLRPAISRRAQFQRLYSHPTRSSSTTTPTEPQHSTLSTFLAHAKRHQLDRTSTTFAGTYYEYATQAVLRRYGFELTRVGGRGDRGVDLKGVWTIATATTDGEGQKQPEIEIPVIVQCKRLKNKVGPNLIRELEGAVAGRSNSTLAVLVGTRGATRGVREAMGRSRVGVVWVMLELGEQGEEKEGEGKEKEMAEKEEEEEDHGFDGILQTMKDEIVSKVPVQVQEMMEPQAGDPADGQRPVKLGRVRQMLWNRAASAMGLEGLDVLMKYDGTKQESGDEVGKEVLLMWQGKPVVEFDHVD